MFGLHIAYEWEGIESIHACPASLNRDLIK